MIAEIRDSIILHSFPLARVRKQNDRGHGHGLMLVAGVIEIIAGLGVLFKPKFFAYVVSAWLLGHLLEIV